MTNTCVDNTDNNDDNDVPPAVMRSLRNIRRDVVVDLEGRNVLRWRRLVTVDICDMQNIPNQNKI